jgi:DNA-binding response OmpR family regulator
MDQRSVLVVEDDAAIRELVAELLNDAGYVVFEADRGSSALRLARQHALSVVLTDHMLPDMTGLDLLEQLRESPSSRHIPIMLISGRAHQLADGDHGADRLLAKPFDIDILLEHVGALTSYTRQRAS